MAAVKRRQNNALLYALITFVSLFIIATCCAVISYVKFEEQKTKANDSVRELNKWASRSEQQKGLGKIVGIVPRGKSGIGAMDGYLDELMSLIIGGVPEDTSAEVKRDVAETKVESINKKVKDALLLSSEQIAISDANLTGLIPIIEKLKAKLDNIISAKNAVEAQLDELQNRFDDAMAAGYEKEQVLLAEKEKYSQQIQDIGKSYNELRALLEQTTDQQIQSLAAQKDEAISESENLKDELLKAQAIRKIAQDKMAECQSKLKKIVPPPDAEASIQSDGKIVLLDEQTKIVHLDIGSNDRVYPGLTFSVYDKSVPIPKDGKGKAEIEVFDVQENISSAQIVSSEPRQPIILGDIVANLIWDSSKSNLFVIAGQFDLDDDGAIDPDAIDRIKSLIEKWGGKVESSVSIKTDFIVLGEAPKVLKKPSIEETEIYPWAMGKYQQSLQRLANYKEVQSQAKLLGIPVFNYERFLYLIGYKAQVPRAGSF